MKIVVAHLTRMHAPFVCVAGIDLDTGKHVRPVLEFDQLGLSLTARHGGPFDIGSVVDLGPVRYAGRAPEVEDWRFDRKKARRMRAVASNTFWDMLAEPAQSTLIAIFGNDLRRCGDTFVTDVGRGQASLGLLVPDSPPVLLINESGKIRLRVRQAGGDSWLPVTDLRLYAYANDQFAPRPDIVRHVTDAMRNGTPVILGVGLTRPMFGGGTTKRHWLQVNNIHLAGNPSWGENNPYSNVTRGRPG